MGKGVACARIRVPRGGFGARSAGDRETGSPIEEKKAKAREADEDGGKIIEVFTTHLHAPYEREPNDSYLCHRTAQAYFISKLVRDARERGHLAIACGDFNMVPESLAYQLVTAHGGVDDVWTSGSDEKETAETKEGKSDKTVQHKLQIDGCTCDSLANTWRWPKEKRQKLENRVKRRRRTNDEDKKIDWDEEESPWAKRLDYIFFGQPLDRRKESWKVERKAIGMTQRHPTLCCSMSDHFSVEATLVRTPSASPATLAGTSQTSLSASTYSAILALTTKYVGRERFQRKARIGHFSLSVVITIGCWVAVWWSPRNFVAFILILLASLGLMAGAVDGLIGFLFVGSEMACLKEFQWEMERLNDIAMEHEDKG